MSNLLLYAALVLCWQQFMIHAEIQDVPVVNGTNETDNLPENAPNFINRRQGADVLLSQEVRHDAFVGFTAWAQASQSLNNGDIVVFDGVTINEGGFYDVNSNTFTCPFDGVYFISVTIRGYGDSYSCVDLMKESESLFYIFSYGTYNPDNIASHSLTVMCTVGERIWVESKYDDNNLYGETGIPHTTFTIMLMNQQSMSDLLHNTFDGFTAYASGQVYYIGDLILFREILLNEGNHFNPDLHLFVCPVDGIYYVMTTFHSSTTNNRIMLGVEKEYIILHSEHDVATINTISNNRLFYCLQGEQISVKAIGTGQVTGGPFSSFSVMLLHEQATASKGHSLFIGFSAWKKMNQNYNSGDDIIFDGIMINEGNGFNLNTSTFECPVPGIYYVSVNFKKVGSGDIRLGVEYQSTSILRSEEISGHNHENTVSNSCIVHCVAGEKIKVVATGSGSVCGDPSKTCTTFTIFLMYEY